MFSPPRAAHRNVLQDSDADLLRTRGLSPSARRRASELACKPGSVRAPCGTRDDHPSGTAVADDLMRSTRRLGRAALERLRSTGRSRRLLTLLRVGFTEPPQSPAALVVSYTTVSPLPPG